MIYPKTMTVREVAQATDRSSEEVYRLLDGMHLSAPVGRQILEGFFAQTLIARAAPVTDDIPVIHSIGVEDAKD